MVRNERRRRLGVCAGGGLALDRLPTVEPPIAPADRSALAPDALSELMVRVAAQDAAALRSLYDATRAKLFGVALRILSDRGESEDVLQEVYLTVWRRAGAFDPQRASASAWLTAVTRNRAIDRLRARGARPTAPIEAASAQPDPAPDSLALVERSDEGRRLAACLDELKPEQAQAIRIAFLEGVAYETLARRLGKPPGTVKSWIRRGLARLGECLGA